MIRKLEVAIRLIDSLSGSQLKNVELLASIVRLTGLSPYAADRELYADDTIYMCADEGICQNPDEIAQFLYSLKDISINTYLEVGTGHGWTVTIVHEILKKWNPNITSYALDIRDNYKNILHLSKVNYIIGTSDDLAGRYYDLVFIDANHSYYWAQKDYSNVGIHAKICGFHDIDDVYCPDLKRLWNELKPYNIWREFIKCPSKLGIGALYKVKT